MYYTFLTGIKAKLLLSACIIIDLERVGTLHGVVNSRFVESITKSRRTFDILDLMSNL